MPQKIKQLFSEGIDTWLQKPRLSRYWLNELRLRPAELIFGLPGLKVKLEILIVMRNKYGHMIPRKNRDYLDSQINRLRRVCRREYKGVV